MNEHDFTAGMETLNAFHGKKMSSSAKDVWWDRIQSLNGKAFRLAVNDAIDSVRGYPLPGVLRGMTINRTSERDRGHFMNDLELTDQEKAFNAGVMPFFRKRLRKEINGQQFVDELARQAVEHDMYHRIPWHQIPEDLHVLTKDEVISEQELLEHPAAV